MVDEYHETRVKVNDSILDPTYNRLTLVDSTGTSLGAGYSRAYTYGKVAQIHLCVYNTNSIAVGSQIYSGTLLNCLPVDDIELVGRFGTNQVIIGRLGTDGAIFINNTGRSSFASSSSNYITLTATYIYK